MERTESQGRVSVTVRLRENRVDLTRRVLGTRIHQLAEEMAERHSIASDDR